MVELDQKFLFPTIIANAYTTSSFDSRLTKIATLSLEMPVMSMLVKSLYVDSLKVDFSG